jgi:uncharacterized protein YyaL (SSP411 family)
VRIPPVLAAMLLVLVLVTGAGARAADPPALPPAAQLAADRESFAALADAGLTALQMLWWSPDLGWYKSRPDASGPQPLPSLWYSFPVFEAFAARAIAEPSPENKAAVDAVALRAERYWDPTIAGGAGGFSWYFGLRGTGNAYFDDNGWWGIAYLDAYRATGNKRWLWDAARALTFIDRFGWDRFGGGGTWWDLDHDHKTSEPLAAGALIAATLYRIQRKPVYLQIAKRYIAWADAHTRDAVQGGLYGRNATDPTVMDYVEGMMLGADLQLCKATRVTAWCTKAEQIAAASLNAFPILADWEPQSDVIYLRFLLDLYNTDLNPRWYAVVYANAKRAQANAGGGDGLWPKQWDGGWIIPGAIYAQGATVELYAWLAAAKLPAAG